MRSTPEDAAGPPRPWPGEAHQPLGGPPPQASAPAARPALLAEPIPAPRPGQDQQQDPALASHRWDGSGARLAMLCYLTVPLLGFVVPLAVRVTAGRRSRWLRAHAAQALNVWLTVMLYQVSAAIMGTMLALDSPLVAVIVVLPVLFALWLAALVLLVRAASLASLGRRHTLPGWLCSRIVR